MEAKRVRDEGRDNTLMAAIYRIGCVSIYRYSYTHGTLVYVKEISVIEFESGVDCDVINLFANYLSTLFVGLFTLYILYVIDE